ncbi:MAG: hypothetical protein FWF88_08315 [Peptococcaceae bacterium]|nr:hypothetical protein [Peptococcaceae bacterium]
MTDQEIKKALTTYTQEASEQENAVKIQLMRQLPDQAKKPAWMPKVAAVTAVMAVVTMFFAFTPPGEACTQYVYANIIQKVFVPKEIKMNLEGIEEDVPHNPYDKPAATSELAGYVIYIDEANYSLQEENGVDVIRAHDQLSQDLPECKMEIRQIPSCSPQQAASEDLAMFAGTPGTEFLLGQKVLTEADSKLSIHVRFGPSKWDTKCVSKYYVDNQKGGVFVISLQYFLEAEEGHGERFLTALGTFEVLPD